MEIIKIEDNQTTDIKQLFNKLILVLKTQNYNDMYIIIDNILRYHDEEEINNFNLDNNVLNDIINTLRYSIDKNYVEYVQSVDCIYKKIQEFKYNPNVFKLYIEYYNVNINNTDYINIVHSRIMEFIDNIINKISSDYEKNIKTDFNEIFSQYEFITNNIDEKILIENILTAYMIIFKNIYNVIFLDVDVSSEFVFGIFSIMFNWKYQYVKQILKYWDYYNQMKNGNLDLYTIFKTYLNTYLN